MNNYRDHDVTAVGRLLHWCEAPSPPFSLAVGATCGCDLSRLEREVCQCVNDAGVYPRTEFDSFDFEDIRYLAGIPSARRFVMDKARMAGADFDGWNDYELVLRGLASLGGVVIGGQGALDATKGVPNVCRMLVTRCEDCKDPGIGRIHPDLCGTDSVVKTIAGRFLEWLMAVERRGLGTRVLRVPNGGRRRQRFELIR